MSAHHDERFEGKRGAYVKVKAAQGQGRVSMFAVDASNEMTFNPLAPDQARDIARSLQEAATLAEEPLPGAGDVVVSAGQLRSAPCGTILLSRMKTSFTKTGSATLRGAVGYYNVGEAARAFGPFTVLYAPEVPE